MKTLIVRIAAAVQCAVILLITLSVPAARAQGFPEPSVVLYGKVVQITTGSSYQLLEGSLKVTFANEQNPANLVTLETALGPVGEGGAFSYVLEIPQKYLPRPLELGEVLSTGARPTSFRFQKLTVNGFNALPLDGSVDSITTSFQQRAQQIRLDLRVTLPNQDTDGDGLPDWWETQYGLNPNFPDAAADNDADGRTNHQEFRDGTDPNQSNTKPILRTARLRVPERGRAGLLLNILDSDSTSAQLTITFKSLATGFTLQRNGQAVSPNATFTLADVAAGRLVLLHHDATKTTGTLAIEFKDQNNPTVPASIEVLVFQPSLADGTEASLWLDAYQINAADKARPAEWRDRSGQNNHAWQPGNTQRPEFAANADGKPAVDFNGNQRHFLLEDKALPLGDATFLAVYDAPRIGGPETVLAANRLALTVEKHSGNVSYPGSQTFTKDDLQVSGRYNVRDRRVVSSVEFAGSTGVAFANERFDGLAKPNATPVNPVEPALGLQRRLGVSESDRFSNDFEGKIREIIAFPEKLDSVRRQRITDYLESKWQNATLWDWSDEGSPVTIQGGATRNIIRGGWGADVLRGGAADDLIAGGPGDDLLAGGIGSDTFSYTPADTGRDVIEGFRTDGTASDVLDLSELFAGKSGDAREYMSLRTESVRVGDNLVSRAVLSIRLNPTDTKPYQEIVLQGLALNTSDLGRLIGEGVILTGSLVIPVTVTVEAGAEKSSPDTAQPSIRVARAGNLGSGLEVPLALASLGNEFTGFTLAGLAGDDTRQLVRFARGETEKIIHIVPRASALPLASQLARVEILPQAHFTISQASVDVVLDGTKAPVDYAAWAEAHFSPGAASARTAPEGDYDTDGASNLAEYTFGTDPTQPGSAPSGLQIALREGRLELTLTTHSGLEGLRFVTLHRVELGAPDQDVSAEFEHEESITAEGRRQHLFLSKHVVPANPNPIGFYRIQIVMP